jgi:hypothetical protein
VCDASFPEKTIHSKHYLIISQAPQCAWAAFADHPDKILAVIEATIPCDRATCSGVWLGLSLICAGSRIASESHGSRGARRNAEFRSIRMCRAYELAERLSVSSRVSENHEPPDTRITAVHPGLQRSTSDMRLKEITISAYAVGHSA